MYEPEYKYEYENEYVRIFHIYAIQQLRAIEIAHTPWLPQA